MAVEWSLSVLGGSWVVERDVGVQMITSVAGLCVSPVTVCGFYLYLLTSTYLFILTYILTVR